MFALIALMPLVGVPLVGDLIRILIITLILMVIIAIIRSPQVGIPAPWGQYAVWIVAAALVIFLVWEALTLTGLL